MPCPQTRKVLNQKNANRCSISIAVFQGVQLHSWKPSYHLQSAVEGGKGFSVIRELGIFLVKREIKDLIHVNLDKGHFRDSVN